MNTDPSKQFQDDLKATIFRADPSKIDRKELLVDIFKTAVAKLFELQLEKSRTKDRLEFEQLVLIKKSLISQFRGADLSEYQMSEKQYEELFNATVQEIMNDAAHAHSGEDFVEHAPQELLINANAYRNAHGMPAASLFKKTPAGIMIPK